MKNLIIILIDALNVDALGPKTYKRSPSVFLDNLREKSNNFDSVYSSAPYTEGATLEFMGGYNTLDYNSFMENLKCAPTTLFETFSNNGYDVYSSIYNYPNNDGFRRGVNYPRVMGLVYPMTLWNYRFKYYSQLKQKKELDENDYKVLISLCGECIENWKKDLNGLIKETYEYQLVLNETTPKEEIRRQIKCVEDFETSFIANQRSFVEELLSAGTSHKFFSTYLFLSWPSTKRTNEIHSMIKTRFDEMIKKMSALQKKGNRKYIGNHLKNACKVLTTVLNDCRESGFKNVDKTKLINRLLELSIYHDLIIQRVFRGKEDVLTLKDTPCASTQFEDFLDWNKNKYDGENPFLAFLHLDDLHVTPIPYSYTSSNEQLIIDELEGVSEYIDQLDDNYHGNILYDASIFNLDKKIEGFMNELDHRGVLDNTLVLLTSDHGFYYTYDAFRTDSIENVHRENYHVLCMMYDKSNGKKQVNSNFHAQKDIPVMLLNQFDIPIPISFKGRDMTKNSGRDYNMIEYPGRGCPDLRRKTMVLSAYNAEYKVYARIKLNEECTWSRVVEVFDLVDDIFETKNIVRKAKSIDKVMFLFEVIKKRHQELRNQYGWKCEK